MKLVSRKTAALSTATALLLTGLTVGAAQAESTASSDDSSGNVSLTVTMPQDTFENRPDEVLDTREFAQIEVTVSDPVMDGSLERPVRYWVHANTAQTEGESGTICTAKYAKKSFIFKSSGNEASKTFDVPLDLINTGEGRKERQRAEPQTCILKVKVGAIRLLAHNSAESFDTETVVELPYSYKNASALTPPETQSSTDGTTQLTGQATYELTDEDNYFEITPLKEGQDLTLEMRTDADGSWEKSAVVKTDKNGAWKADVTVPSTGADYRVTYAGAHDLQAATSEATTVSGADGFTGVIKEILVMYYDMFAEVTNGK